MTDLLTVRKVLKDFLHPDILIGTPVPVSGLQILKPYLLKTVAFHPMTEVTGVPGNS